jgi:O-antigen/teichoic acid export membrane protein
VSENRSQIDVFVFAGIAFLVLVVPHIWEHYSVWIATWLGGFVASWIAVALYVERVSLRTPPREHYLPKIRQHGMAFLCALLWPTLILAIILMSVHYLLWASKEVHD